MKLTEGLRAGDLDNLILPVVSVDEYESKTLDDALVVGFQVNDKEPATDLKKFIFKSGLDLLDVDVSPGPDENDNYFVFVEFIRDKEFVKKFNDLLEIVKKTTNISKWMIQSYHENKLYEYSEDNIKKRVRLKSNKIEEQILKYVSNSVGDYVSISVNKLKLDEQIYKIIDFGDANILYKSHNFYLKPIRLDETAHSKIIKLENKLGPDWNIVQIENYLLCQHVNSTDLLILQD